MTLSVLSFSSCVFLLCSVLCLSACSGETRDDLKEYIQKVLKRSGGAIAPLPAEKNCLPFRYTAEGLNDPFYPADKKQELLENENKHRKKDILENFPLESLTMVGTFRKGSQITALVTDPEHLVHRVIVGQYMGKNNGRVVDIGEDFLRINEAGKDKVLKMAVH